MRNSRKSRILALVASTKPFLGFVIETDLLKRVDDFRFKYRFLSRAAAIKWLLDFGLKQKPKPETVPLEALGRPRNPLDPP